MLQLWRLDLISGLKLAEDQLVETRWGGAILVLYVAAEPKQNTSVWMALRNPVCRTLVAQLRAGRRESLRINRRMCDPHRIRVLPPRSARNCSPARRQPEDRAGTPASMRQPHRQAPG